MSLNVLYCEGNSKSLDIRLLQQLLPGTCLIKPIGGKFYGFEDKIISDRAINPKLAGWRDRDFDCRDLKIANEPIEMKNKLQEFGFNSKDPINEFLARVFQRIELSEDVWTWMPEWQKLRESITNFDN